MSKKEKIKELESKLEEAQNEIDAYRQMTIESGLLPEIDEIAPDVKSLKRLEIDLETGTRKEIIVDGDSDDGIRMPLAADKQKISAEELKDIADIKDKEPEKASDEEKSKQHHIVLPSRLGMHNHFYVDIITKNFDVYNLDALLKYEIDQWDCNPYNEYIGRVKSEIDSILSANKYPVRVDTIAKVEEIIDKVDELKGFGDFDAKEIKTLVRALDEYSRNNIAWEFKRIIAEKLIENDDTCSLETDEYTLSIKMIADLLTNQPVPDFIYGAA